MEEKEKSIDIANQSMGSLVDNILDEIDETERKENEKESWSIGTKCEIFSHSQQIWVNAQIIKIFSDDEGEWLMVKYLNNTGFTKEIQRFSRDIRPTQNNQPTVNVADIDNDNDINWNDILQQIKNGNVTFIKNLITANDIDINAQNPLNGKTLLIYATIIGNMDLLKAICDFGADVHVKDNDGNNALFYAMRFGRYKITELLYYQQLSGTLGNDLKNIATTIHQKNKEAELMKDFGTGVVDMMRQSLVITEYMVKAIENRNEFGEDMLYYAWYFVCQSDCETAWNQEIDNAENEDQPLQSKLWLAMMKTFESILSNTSDKEGWLWLKKYFINSLIWFLPHPINNKNDEKKEDEEEDDGGDNIEKILQHTLFF
eukprot:299073_1